MSSNVLAEKDANTTTTTTQQIVEETSKPDIKSMEYHRQVLQSKMDQQKQAYVSPSDSLQSPCTQKLSEFRAKSNTKLKGRSLFARTTKQNMGTLEGDALFSGAAQENANQEK